ncbi:MAG: methyltransferase domain-containing protein [Candidatus Omnitrophota bacterium]|nr:MAG: methyltransferase domain-containing protein [Candidatus Omnitrophota bacterium]
MAKRSNRFIVVNTLRKVHKNLGRFIAPLLPSGKFLWRMIAQNGEYLFHRTSDWRPTEDFSQRNAELFDNFGFRPDSFVGKTIIDIGAGSRLITIYFKDAKIIAIEPLAQRFLKTLSWCDLHKAHKIYSTPAEKMISELKGIADVVISINVLDHCYNFEAIIKNIKAYLKPGGLAFLSFDSHTDRTDLMHPLILTPEKCECIFRQEGFLVEKFTVGLNPQEKTYAGGKALNYWLKKASG